MFKRILIANRGEIACRIIATAKKMNIKTIAIYSDIDKNAKHVNMADSAYYLGDNSPTQSYLNIKKIIDIAKKAQADAIHPGYGFLSENTDFALECTNANIIFIGPDPHAIKVMGSKTAAKSLMEKSQVPLIPGYHGDKQDNETLMLQAQKIGFPVLIKAAFGGGGKGMRVVDNINAMPDAIDTARREALSSFDNGKLLLEKYLPFSRHIEIQIFGDMQGNYVYLADRDCSIQRRYQKIIEEAPAPDLSPQLRTKMGQAAIKAAQAINYHGAGTIEFLLDSTLAGSQDFYFMEMNTRLQVEHPVTEMITDQDLVKWQILIANGENLPLTQDEIVITGHAIEARIYAENPQLDFLPTSGKIDYLQEPINSATTRLDTGIQKGDEISSYYDPMIAKLICHGGSRSQALSNLHRALNNYKITGITHNIHFLKRLIQLDAFQQASICTHFITQHKDALFNSINDDLNHHYLVAAYYLLLRQQAQIVNQTQEQTPWHTLFGFRLNQDICHQISLIDEQNKKFTVNFIKQQHNQYKVDDKNHQYIISGELINSNTLALAINDQKYHQQLAYHNGMLTLFLPASDLIFNCQIESHHFSSKVQAESSINAPMNGTIISHIANINTPLMKGDLILIMEAMKMEYKITAPADGIIKQYFYQEGDLAHHDKPLVEFQCNEESLSSK